MLVILTEKQVLSTKQVCSNCLMADSAGSPRWRQGKLCCGHLIENTANDFSSAEAQCKRAKIYQCQMGFHLTNIKQ